jgi:hypothetical protein
VKSKAKSRTQVTMRRRPCAVCESEFRGRIDYLLCTLGGKHGHGRRQLAEKFGISESSIQRHSQYHISDSYRTACKIGPFESEDSLRRLVAENGSSVLENYRALYAGHLQRWLNAQMANNDEIMIRHGQVMSSMLQKMGLLTKELAPPSSHTLIQNNWFASPEYYNFTRRAIAVLQKHPEALRDWHEAFKDEPEPARIEHAGTAD